LITTFDIKQLKYGFHKKSFILNETLVSCPFPSSLLGGFAVAPTSKAAANPPKSEDGNGQLTRVAFKINDFL
jgi:hypothetical protein